MRQPRRGPVVRRAREVIVESNYDRATGEQRHCVERVNQTVTRLQQHDVVQAFYVAYERRKRTQSQLGVALLIVNVIFTVTAAAAPNPEQRLVARFIHDAVSTIFMRSKLLFWQSAPKSFGKEHPPFSTAA